MATLVEAQVYEDVQQLYDQGLYLQAYERSKAAGPLKSWQEPEQRILASRLMNVLGAPRLSSWHIIKAFRQAPHLPDVRYFYGYYVLHRRGLYALWRFLNEPFDASAAKQETHAAWLALHGTTLAKVRDFEGAWPWIEKAVAVAPQHAWTHVCKAEVLECDYRFPEALESIETALGLQAWYRPAVMAKAHLLTEIGKPEEAIDYLRQAIGHLEFAFLHFQLASIYLEAENFDALEQTLDQIERLLPLLELKEGLNFYSLKSYLAYRRGDDQAAIEFASKDLEDETSKTFVARLQDPAFTAFKRKELPVKFIRQHHHTCAPTTLAMLSEYWGKPTDHLQVADEIKYEGTSNLMERRWATQNGFCVREFTVNEDSTSQLIDSGIPFSLTTINVGMGHAQVGVGIDRRRGSFVIRDPGNFSRRETFLDEFLRDYRAFGPRGMAMVPPDKKPLLDSLQLPDSELWELSYQLHDALDFNRRNDAATLLGKLRQINRGHLITLHAEYHFASYDGNPARMRAAIEKLLTQFPDNQVLQEIHVRLLLETAPRSELLAVLEKYSSQKDAHPRFHLRFAQELSRDARQHLRAEKLLRKCNVQMPWDAEVYFLLARLRWEQRKFDEALELHRFAASLEETREAYAQEYLRVAHVRLRAKEAFRWMQVRFQRLGKKSLRPGLSLHWACQYLGRAKDAVFVLEEALRFRPDDPSLQLAVADELDKASSTYAARVDELLQLAKDRAPSQEWLSVAAGISRRRGQHAQALKLWKKLLVEQPLSAEAHYNVALLLEMTQGKDAAVKHLEAAVSQFPHHHPLLRTWVEFVRDHSPTEGEAAVRRLLELDPGNEWGLYELAIHLMNGQKLEEAVKLVNDMVHRLPNDTRTYMLAGLLFSTQGNREKAQAAFRRSIVLDVDNSFTINKLLENCQTAQERRQELEFLRDQLIRQVHLGEGLLQFQSLAKPVLEPAELGQVLTQFLTKRSDLWQSWFVNIQQCIFSGDLRRAEALAKEATARFSLCVPLWQLAADVCEAAGNSKEELEYLETAARIDSSSSRVLRHLSEFHDRQGNVSKCQEVLSQALVANPADVAARYMLAQLLGKQNQPQEALTHVCKMIEIDPDFTPAWEMLSGLGPELEQPQLAEQMVRKLLVKSPHRVALWLRLAEILPSKTKQAEILAAIDRAIQLEPRNIEAHRLKACVLAEAEKFQEALDCCRPKAFGDAIPLDLKLQAARIEWGQGHNKEAVAMLEQFLAADNSQVEVWHMLYSWYGKLEELDKSLQAARQLVRLAPQNALAHTSLGIAYLVKKEIASARDCFSHALKIDPKHELAGLHLCDLEIEQSDYAAAERTLHLLETQAKTPAANEAKVRLALSRNDRPRLIQALAQTCRAKGIQDFTLGAIYGELEKAELLPELCKVFGVALNDGVIQPDAAYYYGLAAYTTRLPGISEHLRAYFPASPAHKQVVQGWFRGAAFDENDTSTFRPVLWSNRDWIATDQELWTLSMIGSYDYGENPPVAELAQHWKQFTDLSPMTLVAVAEIFRNHNNQAASVEVSRHAIAQYPGKESDVHRLWLLFDCLARHEYDAAFDYMKQLHPAPPRASVGHYFLQELSEILMRILTLPRHLRQPFSPYLQQCLNELRNSHVNELKLWTSRAALLGWAQQWLKEVAGPKQLTDWLPGGGLLW